MKTKNQQIAKTIMLFGKNSVPREPREFKPEDIKKSLMVETGSQLNLNW